MTNEEKLKELLADKDFTVSLLGMETPEQVQEALQAKGVELEIADIEAVRKLLETPSEGELTDDALETVSGGSLTILAAIGFHCGFRSGRNESARAASESLRRPWR